MSNTCESSNSNLLKMDSSCVSVREKLNMFVCDIMYVFAKEQKLLCWRQFRQLLKFVEEGGPVWKKQLSVCVCV